MNKEVIMKVKDLTNEDYGKDIKTINSEQFPEYNGRVVTIGHIFRRVDGYYAACTLYLKTSRIFLNLNEDTEIEFVEE